MRRQTSQFTIITAAGKQTVTLFQEITSDDLLRTAIKSYITSRKRGTAYKSPITREAVDHVLSVRVAQRA